MFPGWGEYKGGGWSGRGGNGGGAVGVIVKMVQELRSIEQDVQQSFLYNHIMMKSNLGAIQGPYVVCQLTFTFCAWLPSMRADILHSYNKKCYP